MKKNMKLKKVNLQELNDGEGSWIVSYADMITLLCGFFVLFFSFDFNNKKEEALETSVLRSISLLNTEIADGRGVHSKANQNAIELNEISTFVKKESNGDLVVLFKGANFFDSGQTKLNAYGKIILEKFISKYMPYAGQFKVKIQAFTDDQPVTQNKHRYQDNIELSALRSISVLRYLQKSGVPLRRTEIGGKGIMSEKAFALMGITSDDKAEIRAMSRTVAFVLHREND